MKKYYLINSLFILINCSGEDQNTKLTWLIFLFPLLVVALIIGKFVKDFFIDSDENTQDLLSSIFIGLTILTILFFIISYGFL